MNEDLICRLEALLDRYPEINGGFDADIRLVIRRLAQVDGAVILLPAAIRHAANQFKEKADEETRIRQEALQVGLDYFVGDERLFLLMAGKGVSRR